MKKILSLLGIISISSISTFSVVSCIDKVEHKKPGKDDGVKDEGNKDDETGEEEPKDEGNKEDESEKDPIDDSNDIYEYDSEISYHVLSVGNGEFTYLQVGNKAVILDAGRGRPGIVATDLKIWRETKTGWAFIQNEFKKNGIDEIEAIFISHAHEDHTWLLGNLIKDNSFKVNNIIMPPTNYEDTKNHFLNDYQFEGKIWTELQPFYNFLDFEIENLTYYIDPDELVEAGEKNANDSSLILRIKLFDKTLLFTGDSDLIEAGLTDGIVIKKLAEKPIDLFVLPHHGSKVSAVEPMLNAIGQNVQYAFISGTFATKEWKTYGGGFRFPNPETITFLKEKASQAEVFVTGVLPQKPLENDPNFYDQVKGTNQSYTYNIVKYSSILGKTKYANKLIFNPDTIINFQPI